MEILQYNVKTWFQECFEFFREISCIKKGVVQTKNKELKNVIIKKSATKVFQICISIVYNSFILGLSISISAVILEITQNANFFQNTCFKKNDNIVVEKI